MTADPIAADIVRCCEAAGLCVDTVDRLPGDVISISTVYVACIFPLDVPESDSATIRRVALQCQRRFWVRAVRNGNADEELERLEFEVAGSDEDAPY